MTGEKLAEVVCAATLALLAGCASRTTRVAVSAAALRPVLTASRQQLLDRFQSRAAAIRSLHAAVRLKVETGSAFAGVIKEYRQISAVILAERPGWIRVVGQAPVVGTDIFDMVSDGKTFRMYIPSKKKFLVGPAASGETAKKAIDNLRPQPLFDALIWRPIPPGNPVLLEEENELQPASRDYVLTVLQRVDERFEIDRRIWFDRTDLQVSRVEIFGPGGWIESDIRCGDWRAEAGGAAFPWRITLWRPHDDYRLEINVVRLTLNLSIPVDRFRLDQPTGSERVEIGKAGDVR